MWDNLTLSLILSLDKLGRLVGDWLDAHLINIIVIVLGAWTLRHFGARIISGVLRHTVRADLYPLKSDREKRIKTLNTLVGAVVRVSVYIIAAILLVGEINPNYATALFASAGVIGIAIGFGAKDLINDFVSGIFIIIENQYRIGDIIEISDESGIVEDITIRTTVLRDLDGNVHHVPNGSIGVTTNMTLGYSSINVDVTVGYDTDIARLEHVINHVGQEMAADAILKPKLLEPPYFERVDDFGDNGMLVKILGKTVTGEQWLVKGELYKRLHQAFQKNHITIPYPHVVVIDPKKAKD